MIWYSNILIMLIWEMSIFQNIDIFGHQKLEIALTIPASHGKKYKLQFRLIRFATLYLDTYYMDLPPFVRA